MGMFDYLYINPAMLPVTEDERKAIGKNPGWQTKDIECQMTEVYITDEGLIQVNQFEMELVPEEERPHPNDPGILGCIGMLRRVNERLETLDITESICFYSDVKGEWFEFVAFFVAGKLDKIIRIKDLES